MALEDTRPLEPAPGGLPASAGRPRFRWEVAPEPPAEQVRGLAPVLGLSPLTARLLAVRGISDPEAARRFLFPSPQHLHDPYRLKGMDRAVARIRQAVETGEPICVYGDYDVDGQTSVAMLTGVLRSLGAAVEFYIPQRLEEGYGLNAPAIRRIAEAGARLLIAVDCGVSAVEEAALAAELGLEVVIVDHHEPLPRLPEVHALIDPKQPGCPYPERELSAAGLCFKLVQALTGWDGQEEGGPGVAAGVTAPLPSRPRGSGGKAITPDPAVALGSFVLQLAALGTVADVVPLSGENRVIASLGLSSVNAHPIPALSALIRVAGLQAGGLDAWHISFVLGPRLNAVGRMADASVGVRLLLEPDLERALGYAEQLDAENRTRREVEVAILEEALAQWSASGSGPGSRAAVVAGEGWHPGVIGIVASRLVDRLAIPAAVISIEGEEARGSARSVPGFHLFHALERCADLLSRFGGHAMAAGFSLPVAHLQAFRERLDALAREALGEEEPRPKLRVDGWVELEAITVEQVRELRQLAPFGLGNPSPVLAAPAVRLKGIRPVGSEGLHLRFVALPATGDGPPLPGIGFGMAGRLGEWMEGRGSLEDGALPVAHLAFEPAIDRWNGSEQVQLRLRDLVPVDLAARDPHGPRPPVPAGPPRLASAPQEESSLGQASPALLAGPLCAPGARPIRVADLRRAGSNPEDLEPVARWVLETPGPVWVDVAPGTKPWVVAQQLQQVARPLAGAAGWLPEDADAGILRGVGEALRTGKLRAVVGSAAALLERLLSGSALRGLALVHAPESPGQAQRVLRAAALAGQGGRPAGHNACPLEVALAWEQLQVRRAMAELGQRFPPDEGLRAIYRALAGRVQGDLLRWTPGSLADGRGATWPSEAVEHALAVFEEVGLLQATGQEGQWRWTPPPPGHKVDLTLSLRYNEGAKSRKRLSDYLRRSLEAPAPEWVRAFAPWAPSVAGVEGAQRSQGLEGA